MNKHVKPTWDVADCFNWEEGTIKHGRVTVEVRFLPDSRKKIAMDGQFRPYWYDRKRKCWRRTRRGGWYALRRALRHMEETHRGETPTLSQLQDLCRDCNVEFVDLRKEEVTQGSARVRTATEALTQGIEALGRVLDEDKVKGRDQVATILALNFKDSLGRVNPGVILARTETAARNFRARQENIRAIDAWISLYGLLVERLILSLEYHLKEARKQLALYYRHRFGDTPSTPAKVEAYLAAYRWHLTFLRHRPFRLAWTHLDQEATALPSTSSESKARQIMENSLFSLTLLRIRVQLDRMKIHLNRRKNGFPVQEEVGRKIRAVLKWMCAHLRKNTPAHLSDSLALTRSRVLRRLRDALGAYESNEIGTAYQKVDEALNIL